MTPEEIENQETKVVARHADVEALARDLGMAWQEATKERHQLLHSGAYDPEHFSVGLGDVTIARQLCGLLRAVGFQQVLEYAQGAPNGDKPQPDFAAHVANAVAYLAPRRGRSAGDGLTVGQQPTPPRNVQSGLLEQA